MSNQPRHRPFEVEPDRESVHTMIVCVHLKREGAQDFITWFEKNYKPEILEDYLANMKDYRVTFSSMSGLWAFVDDLFGWIENDSAFS